MPMLFLQLISLYSMWFLYIEPKIATILHSSGSRTPGRATEYMANSLLRMMPHTLFYLHLVDTLGYFWILHWTLIASVSLQLPKINAHVEVSKGGKVPSRCVSAAYTKKVSVHDSAVRSSPECYKVD